MLISALFADFYFVTESYFDNIINIMIIINFYFVKIYIFTYKCNKMAYIMLYSAFKMYILDGSLICTYKILDIRASRSFSKILSTS